MRTSAAAQSAARAASTPGSPETTTERGPFTAASQTRSPQCGVRRATSCGASATESMPPRPVRAASARERSATTRAASGSDSAPATYAAAISPWEWPTTAAGRTPYSAHSAASDTITANSTGWTTSTRSSSAGPPPPRRTSSRDQSTCGASASAHSAIRAANAGEESSSPAAIPAHCEPCPGKTSTGPPVGPAAPRTTSTAWTAPAPWTAPATSAPSGSGPPSATAARPRRKPA